MAEPDRDQNAPGPRAARFADATIGAGAALAVVNLLFAVQLHRPRALAVLFAATALLLLAARRLRPARRLPIALVIVPGVLAFYGFEWRLARKRPYDADVAERRGVRFDTRSVSEAIRDARRQGRDAYPSFQPRALLELDLSRGLVADELTSHSLGADWGVLVDGERILPLGGISNKTIVHCNESGAYAVYEADEHGFNNPGGIWDADRLDVALLGDAFTHGACVGPDENAAAWIRRKHPATLNLGMSGDGPLLELATLEEYLAPRKPKVVLWVYFNNDMADLDVEKGSPLLRRYLDEPGFTQRLAHRQAAIDEAFVALRDRVDALAPSWPAPLSSLGLTRQSAPLWVGDLAMRESHSSVTAVLRLDRLSLAIASKLATDHLHLPADLGLFQRVLGRARDRVASWGGRLHFVYMPDVSLLPYRGTQTQHNRVAVLAIARELGLPVIDAHTAFLAQSDPLRLFVHDESHCNADGYALVGELIVDALSREGSGPR